MTHIPINKLAELTTSSPIGDLKIRTNQYQNVESANFRHAHFKEKAVDIVGSREPTVSVKDGSNCYTWTIRENDIDSEVSMRFIHHTFDFREFTCSASLIVKSRTEKKEEPLKLDSNETNYLVKVAIDGLKIKEANDNQLGEIAQKIATSLQTNKRTNSTPFKFGRMYQDDDGNKLYLVQNETFRTPIVLLNGMKINAHENEEKILATLLSFDHILPSS